MATSHVQVRRVLTTTPLARPHERRIEGKPLRKPRPIPWAAFDRRAFPKIALDLALDSYLKTAEAEYGAVEVYAQLTSAMAMAGLPLDLITSSAHICTDEARHSDYALKMASLLTEADVSVLVDKEKLQGHWKAGTSLEEIDAAILHVAAISETIACALVSACMDRARDVTVLALLGNLLSDEVHHARFGWYYLSWRSPQWSQAERRRLADRMASNVVNIERRYWAGRDAPETEVESARALGVLDSEGQRAAVRALMEDEIVPALDSLGLGASHAWRLRRPGPPSS
jgi:hypothetical protein